MYYNKILHTYFLFFLTQNKQFLSTATVYANIPFYGCFPLQSGAGLRSNTDSRCFRLQRSLTQSVRDVTCSSLSHSHSCIFSSCSLNVPSLETGNKTSSRRIHKNTSINNTASSEGRDRCTLRHVHAQARARSCNDILTMFERAGRKQEDPPREHRRAR